MVALVDITVCVCVSLIVVVVLARAHRIHSALRLLLSLFVCGFACKLGKSDFEIEN